MLLRGRSEAVHLRLIPWKRARGERESMAGRGSVIFGQTSARRRCRVAKRVYQTVVLTELDTQTAAIR